MSEPICKILLTPAEVAEITRLSVNTIKQYIHAGNKFPVVRLGRRTLVRRSDLFNWIEKNITDVRSEGF